MSSWEKRHAQFAEQYPKKVRQGALNVGLFIQEFTLKKEKPSPEERAILRELDPSDYSMNPDSAIVSEDFEGDESTIKNWSGGSTTFHSLMKKNLQL